MAARNTDIFSTFMEFNVVVEKVTCLKEKKAKLKQSTGSSFCHENNFAVPYSTCRPFVDVCRHNCCLLQYGTIKCHAII